jgi:hypothetical protein
MPSVPQPPPSDEFRRNVADLYGDRDPSPATTPPAWPQAVAQVSTQLCAKLRIEVPTARLHKALEFVLAHAVTLHADGSASVLSGKQTYTLAPHCPCPDAKNRAELCKHALAVELHRRALALLDGTAYAPVSPANDPAEPTAAPASAPAPAVPTSAAWQVQEAPTSACFKWRVGQAELMYTFRGVTDDEVLERIRETLPLLQDILEACETRADERAKERAAAQADAQAQAQAQHAQQAQAPADMQALIQQAVQQALKAQSNGATGNGHATGHTPTSPPRCPAHGDMRESTKQPGTWFCTQKLPTGKYCPSKA